MLKDWRFNRRRFLFGSALVGSVPIVTSLSQITEARFWKKAHLINRWGRNGSTRFVVFTLPKSGSNLLSHWVSRQAECLYFNGFFIRRPELLQEQVLTAHKNDSNFTGASREFLHSFDDVNFAKEFIHFRDRDFVQFADRLMALPNNKIGFKFEPYFNGWDEKGGPNTMPPQQLADLAFARGWQVITLKRREDFEQYMSLLISLETNYFSFDSSKPKPALYTSGQITVASKQDEFYEIAKLTHKNRQFLQSLDEKPGTLSVDYEDLISGQNISGLEKLVQANAKDIGSLEKKKMLRQYEDCFDNVALLQDIYHQAKRDII